MGPLFLFGRQQEQEPLIAREGRGLRCVLGRSAAAAAAAAATTATAIAPGCGREASETVHHANYELHSRISSAVLPQRRHRPGAAGAPAEASPSRGHAGSVAAAGGDCCGGERAVTRRRLVGRRWSGRASGGGSALPCQPLARCSLAVLAFLSDPASAFQPVAWQAPPQRHQQQQLQQQLQQQAARELRRQLYASAPCRSSCDVPLLQGSFTGRLGRQAAPAAAAAAEERDYDMFRGMDRQDGMDSTSTLQDFPRIVEALSCYKSVHNHLRMIPAFRVPPNAPWPETLWGMELGRMVHRLRNEQSAFKRQYPERFQLLLSMGFEWEHTAVPDEWDLIISGIEMFFRLNSHSRVPMRFTVPAEAPWPMKTWGHKLGSRIAQMRMTGRWLGQDEMIAEERRTTLERYGFEWRLRVKDDAYDVEGNAEEFSIICEGLSVYRQLGGSVPNMPPTWVVPNADPWPIKTRGFPLGAQVQLIRSRQKYAKDSQEKTDILLAYDVPITPTISKEKTGARWRGPTEARFNKLCKALETFVTLYGHAEVPNTFEVPREESWPEVTWDVKLGRSLVNIVSKGTFIKGYPHRQSRLEALGFDTDPGGVRGFKELVRSGMSEADAYAESQALMDFASEAAMGEPGSGSEDLTQMDSQTLLGNVMDSLRSKEAGGSSAGAVLPPSPSLLGKDEVDEGRPERAIAQPKWVDNTDDEDGEDVDVHERKTPVPSFMKTEFTDEDRRLATDQTDLRYWPHETQAHVVRKLIPQLGYLGRGFDEPATLDGPIGTNMVTLPGVLTPLQWDPKRKKEPDEYGYIERDEDDFLEDQEDEMQDGMIDRQKGRRLISGCSTAAAALEWCTEEDREKILKVGFEWDEFGDGFRWDDVVAGLTLYNTLYGELPDDDFKVPVDYEWPIELSGMQLGSICKQMRIGDIWAKHNPKRKKALNELGFDWGDDSLYLYFQWPEVLIAFYSVIKLKGHLDVLPQYVIPHEDPWPLPLHGTPVGFYLNTIKAQRELLIEHYPDRYEILRGMDIMWNEPLLVDWREEEEHLEYPWREWGVVKKSEEGHDDDGKEMNTSLDPEFGLDGTSSIL
ncbi:unnamed protein product [Pylaiella littoralis]